MVFSSQFKTNPGGMLIVCCLITQTFPRLTESAGLPITHVLFTEHSDCTDLILKTPNVGVNELISNPSAAAVLKYFLVSSRSLTYCQNWKRTLPTFLRADSPHVCSIADLYRDQITDVSGRRPTKGPLSTKVKSREIVVAVHKPSNPAQEAAVKAWIQVALNVADLLGKPNVIKPEVSDAHTLIASSIPLLSILLLQIRVFLVHSICFKLSSRYIPLRPIPPVPKVNLDLARKQNRSTDLPLSEENNMKQRN